MGVVKSLFESLSKISSENVIGQTHQSAFFLSGRQSSAVNNKNEVSHSGQLVRF